MKDLQSFVGKDNDDLEKEIGFTHYIELKDFLILKREQEHSKVISTLLKFAENQELKIVKTDDGKIVEIFDLPFDEIKSNLTLQLRSQISMLRKAAFRGNPI